MRDQVAKTHLYRNIKFSIEQKTDSTEKISHS